ncbi:hypothetical protein MD484_g1305, partial [Candolleomyces efflorescens]
MDVIEDNGEWPALRHQVARSRVCVASTSLDPVPQFELGEAAQTGKRAEIGEQMNDQTLECELEVFIESYLSQRRLSQEAYKAIFDAAVKSAEKHFKSSLPFEKEAEIATSLKVVTDAIVKAWKDLGGGGRCLQYVVMSNHTVISCIPGGNFKIDGSLIYGDKSKAPHTTNIVAAMEFKLRRHFDTVGQGCPQITSGVVHIMNDDVRRTFMFGITIEATRMTLWYFSRSHSMKSKSFDFTTDFPTLVNVLISLMFAEDKDLGFDPNIALMSHTNRQYIYTVNGKSGPRRFKTTHSILENCALSVAGRMTRVFRAMVELGGQTNEPKMGVKPMVLKDVWLDEGSKSEMEIQRELFSDIEKFAKERDWREAPSLSAFKAEPLAETMAAFAEYLEGGRYKDLFLVIRDGSTGEASKPLPPSAWTPTSKLFHSVADASQANASAPSTQRLTGPLQANMARDRQLRPESQIDQGIYRDHASKRRSFLLFDDECTRVYCLPKTGDVFAVLRDCIMALRLMLCAGWVHRDISCNNIMAVQDPQTGQWKLKLADLEYSKKFGLNASASDPKTGTPFFMPCEILQRDYFGIDDLVSFNPFDVSVERRPLNAPPRPPDEPLLHNFLHDLEATYWTGLWIITSRVNHEPSLTWGLKVFCDTLTLLPDRLAAFKKSICDQLQQRLLENLREIADLFDNARNSLYGFATVLGKQKAWQTKEGRMMYSVLHARFATLFAILADPEAPWGNVDLQQSASSSPRCMEANEDSDKPQVISSAVQEAQEGTVQQQSNKDAKKNTKGKKKERLPGRLKAKNPDEKAGPAFRRKRSHRDDDEAYEDESEGRSSHSKRVKSNSRGRASGSAPSSASTSAQCT